MTEQEALKYLKDANRNNQMVCILPKSDIGKCLVNALEEVQKYRAIGTVSELQDLVIGINALADSQFSAADMEKLVNDMKSLYEYRQIGTLDECRQAVEKQKAKKPSYDDYHRAGYRCQTCNNVNPWGYKHCKHCGQKLDWSDEE